MSGNKTFIIAEIGNNHEGSFERAVEMIGVAADCGADAVKFQCINPEHLANTPERFAQLERICLTWDKFPRIAKEAERCGVEFLCTPFNVDAVKFLDPLVKRWKIAARSWEDKDLMRAVVRTKKAIIQSVPRGGITWPRADYLLHVVPEYPCPPERANLRRCIGMDGYSDHCMGIEAAVGAAWMTTHRDFIIEKHFTLDHNQSDFRDHKHAADPKEFKLMVERIRSSERFM